MSEFWRQMDRRASISSYNYSVGDEAEPEHLDLTKTNELAADEVKKLDVGDSVFVKRSNGAWSFAALAEKRSDVYTFQIEKNHKFKSLRDHQLGEYVRLVEVATQKASYSKLDINQSSSCESYTDKVIQSKRLKESSLSGIDVRDKENMSPTNKCYEARSVAVSELSMSSPVADVVKQRSSRGAHLFGESFEEESLCNSESDVSKGISSYYADPKSYKTETESLGSTTKLSVQQRPSLPLVTLNSIEEEDDCDDISILDDLLVSKALLSDKSKRNVNHLPAKHKSLRRNSLPVATSERKNAHAGTGRHSIAVEKRSSCRSKSINGTVKKRTATLDETQTKNNNFDGKAWRAKSDVPSEENENKLVESETSKTFNTANWRAKSDQEIVFMPSESSLCSGEKKIEDKLDTSYSFNASNWKAKIDHDIEFVPSGQHDVSDTKQDETSSNPAALVLYSSSKQNSPCSKSNDVGEEFAAKKTSVDGQKRPSNTKRKRRMKFSGAKAFINKKFRKSNSHAETQQNSTSVSDDKRATHKANDNKQPIPNSHSTFDRTQYYAQQNYSAYTSVQGFAPYYYTNPNVYYVSDPTLAQAYRNYAQDVTRAQAAQCSYNPMPNAQINYQMTGMNGANVIRVGSNGISGGNINYNVISAGHGVQVVMPSTCPANVIHINSSSKK